MKIKRVLFVDDGDIDGVLAGLRRKLKAKGWKLQETILNPADRELKKENPTDGHALDFNKIKEKLIRDHMDIKYDLVAVDFNYANDALNGFDVIRWLKNSAIQDKKNIRRARFVTYSSETEKFIGNFKNDTLFKLIRLRIDAHFSREELPQDAAKLLLKEESELIYLSTILRQELEKYPDMVFRSVYPKFNGDPLSKIVEQIDKDSSHSRKFQKNLIELTVAHMLEMNKS